MKEPNKLAEVIAQKNAISQICTHIKNEYKNKRLGCNIMLQARTGVGKTTIANALANEIADQFTNAEFGAKIVSIEELRSWYENCTKKSVFGKTVYILNESQALTADQMTVLLSVLDRNRKYGCYTIILTGMYDDSEITGQKSSNWKPLKDRCFVPKILDGRDSQYRTDLIAYVSDMNSRKNIGYSDNAILSICEKSNWSIREVIQTIERDLIDSKIDFIDSDLSVFDSEIQNEVESLLAIIGDKTIVETIETNTNFNKTEYKSIRKKQFQVNYCIAESNIREAAFEVLRTSNRPLKPMLLQYKITEQFPEIMFVSKNPHKSLNSNLAKDITDNGKNSRFVKYPNGSYSINKNVTN